MTTPAPITSLFQYADFVADYYMHKDAALNPFLFNSKKRYIAILDKAAEMLLAGYSSLAQAEAETLNRIDCWGNEIAPSAVAAAAAYAKNWKGFSGNTTLKKLAFKYNQSFLTQAMS